MKQSIEEIILLSRSLSPLIYVISHDENNFVLDLLSKQKEYNLSIKRWSCYKGIIPIESFDTILRAGGDAKETWIPQRALEYISKDRVSEDRLNIYLLHDFNVFINPQIARQIVDMRLVDNRKILIITAHSLSYGPSNNAGLEPSLDRMCKVVNYDLPSYEEIVELINAAINEYKNNNKSYALSFENEDIAQFARALQGLTHTEIIDTLAYSLVKNKTFNTQEFIQEKIKSIKKSDILEYIKPSTTINEIGGLDKVKQYFLSYKDQFSDEAKQYGVEPLKAVLLLGICGCGKSAIVKTIADLWKLPLLRLDMGRIMGGIVGLSESNMRAVLQIISSTATNILWLDELDKALSGTKSSGQSDGGTLSRVFGTLLTAMEEGMKGTVLLATANDVSQLPPELIRRFNEVFFVDLPVAFERKEIFKIHFEKRNRDYSKLDLDLLAQKTHFYTGAEIEKIIKESIAKSWISGDKELSQKTIEEIIEETKPIAILMKEQINNTRQWAKDRARSASSFEFKEIEENIPVHGETTLFKRIKK